MSLQYWRRRFFKLAGSKLTAYHEATLQPRATINLAKAAKLIDDKSALTQRETSTKGGGRRKSAFAEEEEGYMFVEEGFRIRFGNGEVIDFYADSTAEKEEWMKVLSEVVGKVSGSSGSAGHSKPWTEAVLKRQKSLMVKELRAKQQAMNPSPRKSSKEVARERMRHAEAEKAAMAMQQGLEMQQPPQQRPESAPRQAAHTGFASNPPVPTAPRSQGHMRTESFQPPQQPQKGHRSQANSPVKERMSRADRDKKARSMIDMFYN
jgi:hypothetical protein